MNWSRSESIVYRITALNTTRAEEVLPVVGDDTRVPNARKLFTCETGDQLAIDDSGERCIHT